jgi:hypothetical protein
MKIPLVPIIAFALACTGRTYAVPIFSNPLNNTLSGFGSNDPAATSSQQMADDFSFASLQTIASITWFGNYVNDPVWCGFCN